MNKFKKINVVGGHEAIVDAEDYERVNSKRWWLKKSGSGRSNYAYNVQVKNGKQIRTSMHRFILEIPFVRGFVIDHKNGNGLDNRKKNLRICTLSENAMNSRTPKNNSTGHKGVSFNKNTNKYQVHISFKNKQIFIGQFSNKIYASIAYNTAARIFHGKFAKLNEIPKEYL